MLVSLLCVFSLIAIRGLNLISCDACGKDSFILESGNNHIKEAQPATCGNREDLLYENIANITYNYSSSTLPALPEHIWIEVSSHQVDYISIEFMDTLINATTASSILVADQAVSVLGQIHHSSLGIANWNRDDYKRVEVDVTLSAQQVFSVSNVEHIVRFGSRQALLQWYDVLVYR